MSFAAAGDGDCLSLSARLLPAEALNACTINAAHALALGDRIGPLEAGKQVDANPEGGDYRHLAYFGGNPVETVIKRGSLVLRQRGRGREPQRCQGCRGKPEGFATNYTNYSNLISTA